MKSFDSASQILWGNESADTSCMGLPMNRPPRLRLLPVALLVLTMSASAQIQTGPSSYKVQGQAGHRIQISSTDLGAAPVQQWLLIGRPAGSQTLLENANSSLLSLVPDRQGIYLIEGLIAGGRPLRMKLAIGPAQTLTPVAVDGGGQGDIVVGPSNSQVRYPGPDGAGINVVVLERDTLGYLDHFKGSLSDAKQYLDGQLPKTGSNAIYILATNSEGAGGNLSDLAPELEQLGATTVFRSLGDYSFSFIGSKGLKAGQAYQAGGTALQGYFAPDSYKNYTFIELDYVPFSLTPSKDVAQPSTIQVGSAKVQSSPPTDGSQGGFLLAVFDAASLTNIFQQSYLTLGASPDESIAQQKALAAKLKEYEGNQGVLVFLVSFGSPHNGAGPGASDFGRLAQEIDAMGGTYDYVYNVNTSDTYSLAAWADPVDKDKQHGSEAGSRLKDPNSPDPNATGVLQGALGRARQGNWYHPIASGTNLDNFDLYAIVGQPPEPYPVFATKDALDAYVLISKRTLAPCSTCTDLRATYSDLSIDVDSVRLNLHTYAALENPNDPPSASCIPQSRPDTAYCNTFHQLDTELSDVAQVRSLYKELDDIYGQNAGLIGPELTSAQEQVNKTLQPRPQTPVLGIVSAVIGNVLSAAGAVLGPGYPAAAAAFGVVTSCFNMGTGLALDINGNSTATDVNTQAGQLAEQAVGAFQQEQMAQGRLFQVILEDWGKTSALAGKVIDPNSGYAITPVTQAQILTALNHATEVSLYQRLLSIDWVIRVWYAQSPADRTPGAYKYESEPGVYSIFRDWKDQNYYSVPSPRTAGNTSELDFFMLTKAGPIDGSGGSNSFDPSYIQLEPDTLLRDIFAAPSDKGGGLGVTKTDFYRKWPFQKFYCSAPGGDYSPEYLDPSNCDFTTPQLPQ